MKIFSYIHNASRRVLSDEVSPDDPMSWMVLPDSCRLQSRRPLFIPDFAECFIAIPALGVKIGRVGKSIARRFAMRYASQYCASLIILPLSAKESIKKGEQPPMKDLCFDNAIVIGEMLDNPPVCSSLMAMLDNEIILHCDNPELNLDNFEEAVAEISRRNTLKNGDIILLPSPKVEVTLQPEMTIEIDVILDGIRKELLFTRFK